jgi:hypothetical protein
LWTCSKVDFDKVERNISSFRPNFSSDSNHNTAAMTIHERLSNAVSIHTVTKRYTIHLYQLPTTNFIHKSSTSDEKEEVYSNATPEIMVFYSCGSTFYMLHE